MPPISRMVLSAALYEHFSSRVEADFADKLLSAMHLASNQISPALQAMIEHGHLGDPIALPQAARRARQSA